MEKTIKKFESDIAKAKEVVFREMFDESLINSMGEKEFNILKTMLDLVNSSIELTIKQAEMINEINEKLNRMNR